MMNIIKAIQLGKLIEFAYTIQPNDLHNLSNKKVYQQYKSLHMQYTIVSSIYGSDLATAKNRDRGLNAVSMGFVAQDNNGDIYIVLRGTETIYEWRQDLEFLKTPCSFLNNICSTEDGFTAMYLSLSTEPSPHAKSLIHALPYLNYINPIQNVYICGHSLGAAVATLLAIDLSHNSKLFTNPIVYTFASPKVGGLMFALIYNNSIEQNYRIFNSADLVPKLPESLPFLLTYTQVKGGFILKQDQKQDDLVYQHSMSTYLNLLSLLYG